MTTTMNETEVKTVSGKLYHKTTWEGLDELFKGIDTTRHVCFSTPEANALVFNTGLDVVVVLKEMSRTGEYCYTDMDARKGFSRADEFRYFFPTSDLTDELLEIVVPVGTIEAIENSSEGDENAWKWNLLEPYYSYFREVRPEEEDFMNF